MHRSLTTTVESCHLGLTGKSEAQGVKAAEVGVPCSSGRSTEPFALQRMGFKLRWMGEALLSGTADFTK